MNWKLLRAHMEREGRRDACTYDRLRLSCEQTPDCLCRSCSYTTRPPLYTTVNTEFPRHRIFQIEPIMIFGRVVTQHMDMEMDMTWDMDMRCVCNA